MIITEIHGYRVKVPLNKPYHLSSVIGTIDSTDSIIIKMKTDSGIDGYGEADPIPFFSEETPETIEAIITHHLKPLLIGKNPFKIAEISKIMDEKLNGNLLAKGAIDMALYDLTGKALNIPAHQLLGGSIRNELPLLWPIGSGSINENIEEVKRKLDEGFKTFMIKTGELSLQADIARVRAINSICNDSITLIVDANQGWDVSNAIKFSNSIADIDIAFIEQPIASWNLQGLKEIRQKSPIPISVDESLTSLHEANKIIFNHGADFFSLKVSKHGGLFKTNKIASLAESAGIPCMINSMIELGITQAASLQLAATQHNLVHSGQCLMSTLRIADDITNFGQNISCGKISLPKSAGLGIDVDQNKLEKYTVKNF